MAWSGFGQMHLVLKQASVQNLLGPVVGRMLPACHQVPSFRFSCVLPQMVWIILCKTRLDSIWFWLTVSGFGQMDPVWKQASFCCCKSHLACFWPVLLSQSRLDANQIRHVYWAGSLPAERELWFVWWSFLNEVSDVGIISGPWLPSEPCCERLPPLKALQWLILVPVNFTATGSRKEVQCPLFWADVWRGKKWFRAAGGFFFGRSLIARFGCQGLIVRSVQSQSSFRMKDVFSSGGFSL